LLLLASANYSLENNKLQALFSAPKLLIYKVILEKVKIFRKKIFLLEKWREYQPS